MRTVMAPGVVAGLCPDAAVLRPQTATLKATPRRNTFTLILRDEMVIGCQNRAAEAENNLLADARDRRPCPAKILVEGTAAPLLLWRDSVPKPEIRRGHRSVLEEDARA